MPNFDAFKRYKVIDKMLKGGGRATKSQLITACKDKFLKEEARNVKIENSTIEHDLTYMRSGDYNNIKAPIKKEPFGEMGAYYYSDENFVFFDTDLSENELLSLKFFSELSKKYNDVPTLETLEKAISKVIHEKIFPASIENPEVIDPEITLNNKGNSYLPTLYDSIIHKEVLKITYHRYSEQAPKEHILHPYLLKEYAKRWYLIAWSEEKKDINTFCLDRIIGEVNPKLERKYIVSDKNWKEHYKNSIGIFVYKKDPVEVRLRVNTIIKEYILNPPIHHSQRTIQAHTDYIIVSLKVHPSPELKGEILKWGKNVEVLSPLNLRNEIKKEYEGALKNYTKLPQKPDAAPELDIELDD
jgi:predicted DNA-binding transcriptional regulator YafY